LTPHQRFYQVILIAGLIGFSWPMMMLVHECGHMLGALGTGGHIQQLVWYPIVFSRTDVRPNPSPLVVVCAGPAFGALAPAAVALALAPARWSCLYILNFFAGFCLLSNGVYIGIGTFGHVGDAGDMLRLGMAPWVMFAFGLLTTISGLWLLNSVSQRLGFGRYPATIVPGHAWATLALTTLVYLIGYVIGNPG